MTQYYDFLKNIECLTIPEVLEWRVSNTPNDLGFFILKGEKWVGISWKDFYDHVITLSHFLNNSLNVAPGDVVAIFSPNRLEWEIVQMAVMCQGGIILGLDPREAISDIEHKITISKPKCIFISDEESYNKLKKNISKSLPPAIFFDQTSNKWEGVLSQQHACLQDILKKRFEVLPKKTIINHQSPATVIFTSGTTGKPKGLVYSHFQVLIACKAILNAFKDIDQGIRLMCWLPLANLFQRIINFCAMITGGRTYVLENPRQIMTQISTVRPQILIGVPRFFEKLRSSILGEVERLGPLQKTCFDVALKLSKNRSPFGQIFKKIFGVTIFRPIGRLLGEDFRFAVSGSAPLSKDVLRDLEAMGILCLEAYGISENSVPISVNRPEAYKIGTVGKPLPENEIRIQDDGEVWVRGPGVCKRYLSDVEDLQVVNDEGYLETGDLGVLDEDGFLKIIGRKNDMFKTSTGRKIVPSTIENKIKALPYVDDCIVLGAGKKFVVAILCISKNKLSVLQKKRNFSFEAVLKKDIQCALGDLPTYLYPVGYLILERELSVEKGEITSNLKPRRNVIEKKFKDEIDRIYGIQETVKGDLPIFMMAES